MVSNLYFDYCATTPLHPAVRERMLTVLGENFGNPSSMHRAGRKAREVVEAARLKVAAGINASPGEIIFTSGATEANNLALLGALPGETPGKHHLIISAIEHHAVLHTAQALAAKGFQLTILPVDKQGLISTEALEKNIRPETTLVSIMLVNNEVGTIQDIPSLAEIAHQHGALFHTDAVQAFPCLNVDVEDLGVDLLSLSAHKIYGPKGIGALYIRDGTAIRPMLFGGAQEGTLRPGTENVSGIVGLGAAIENGSQYLGQRRAHLKELRSSLINGLMTIYPDCIINGPDKNPAPHIVSAAFPGIDGETLLFHLSQNGIAASLGSACTSEDLEPSHVLTAMGLPEEIIDSTLRFSLGEPTSSKEIEELVRILSDTLGKASIG